MITVKVNLDDYELNNILKSSDTKGSLTDENKEKVAQYLAQNFIDRYFSVEYISEDDVENIMNDVIE